MRMLSEGAEAKVFETTVFGRTSVVKKREVKHYRIKELDETLRKTRTRKETRAMLRAGEAGVRVPALLGVGKFSIYMEKVTGRLLKDMKIPTRAYAKIGESLARMHDANVTHGDFTPANIIIDGRESCVIDFGLADITDSVEDKALDLLLMKRAVGKEEYAALEDAYSRKYAKAREVMVRLAAIEKRGRYQIRTLV